MKIKEEIHKEEIQQYREDMLVVLTDTMRGFRITNDEQTERGIGMIKAEILLCDWILGNLSEFQEEVDKMHRVAQEIRSRTN